MSSLTQIGAGHLLIFFPITTESRSTHVEVPCKYDHVQICIFKEVEILIGSETFSNKADSKAAPHIDLKSVCMFNSTLLYHVSKNNGAPYFQH